MSNLGGKIALVTGASVGIGLASARLLSEAGVGVIGCARRLDVLRAQMDDLPGPTISLQLDVAEAESVASLTAQLPPDWQSIDILINNAGICPMTSWDQTTLETWNRIIEVNLTGAYLCSKAVLPQMRRQKYGRIVFISSAGAFMGSVTGHVAYGASKAGMLALMKVVAKEFAAEGILANAIAPGSIDTPITESFGPEAKARYAEAATLKRQGSPRELADAVL